MAFFAIGNAVDIKLFCVHILMAGSAGSSQPGEFLAGMAGFLFVEMAVAAGLFGMCAFQFELRFFMVEINGVPTVQVMAGFAVGLGVVLFANKRLVYVFVTILTGFANFPEFPFNLFFVTGKAGRCHMGSF